VLLPNGLTLFNLFCGIFAIVLSSRGDFDLAARFIVLGGIADAMDGRVARATNTGSKFGEELDSLVDAISFGLAPAMIMYFAVLSQTNWQWLLVFIFASCAVMRLARFNVEQAGRKKTHFHGLPSPAAGLTLATYYWFSQTELYSQTVILFTDSKTLQDLPWKTLISFLMAILAALMISNVPYPAFPEIGFRTMRQRIGSFVVLASVIGMIVFRKEFFFPALVIYVLFGAVKFFLLGLIGAQAPADEIYWSGDAVAVTDPAPAPVRHSRPHLVAPSAPAPLVDGVLEEDNGGVDRQTERERAHRRRKRRRGRGGQRPGPGSSSPPDTPQNPDQ
jgi:CDP-diacylglycerol--serine O-phosphatidyltransferase